MPSKAPVTQGAGMQDVRDAQKISYALLCAQLWSIFWRSYSEFATNVQRTVSTLGVYRAHTQRVHCAHAKIERIRAHPGSL